MGAVDFGAKDPLHLGKGACVAVGQRVGHTGQRAGLACGNARHQVAGHLVPLEHEVLRGARGALPHHHGLADGAAQGLLGAHVQAPKPVGELQAIGQRELAHKAHRLLADAHGRAAVQHGLLPAHGGNALGGVGAHAQLGGLVNGAHHQQVARRAQAIHHRLDLREQLAQPVLGHLLLGIRCRRDALAHLFGRPAVEHQQVLDAAAVEVLHGVARLAARAADGGGLFHPSIPFTVATALPMASSTSMERPQIASGSSR